MRIIQGSLVFLPLHYCSGAWFTDGHGGKNKNMFGSLLELLWPAHTNGIRLGVAAAPALRDIRADFLQLGQYARHVLRHAHRVGANAVVCAATSFEDMKKTQRARLHLPKCHGINPPTSQSCFAQMNICSSFCTITSSTASQSAPEPVQVLEMPGTSKTP